METGTRTADVDGILPEGLRTKPPAWAGTLACVIALLITVFAQFFLAATSAFSLGFSLPLLVCLWARNRGLLIGLALLITGLIFIKSDIMFGEPHPASERVDYIADWAIQSFNLWVTTVAVYLAIIGIDRAAARGRKLADANKSLAQTNANLAERESLVSDQNRNLHDQAARLEEQAAELRRRTAELQVVNDELIRRERGLQTLLESARWMRSDLSEADVMSAICQAAVQVTRENVTAAAVVHGKDGKLAIRGQFGFGIHGTPEDVPFEKTFAADVMRRGKTEFINDLAMRPEILIGQPATGRLFQAVLSTPLTIEGRIVGAVEVYARQPREWTDAEFRVIEWLAAQCALAIQAIEYQQEVTVKRQEAEEASRQKTRFLAAVSHDVRTPANAISLMADLIEESAAPGSSQRADIPALARDLKTNARALVELVSDVLDLSRLDTGKHDLQMDEFSLETLLQTVVHQVQPIAEEKKLRLSCGGPGCDFFIQTDKMKLARVLSNLVGNAVKFTEAGSVDVDCSTLPDGGCAVRIRDTGVGIPKEALLRIFDEFFQIQNTERDRNKGSGLGLAICKRLVDVLGCTLTVESEVGVGTTFTIGLPARMIRARPKHPALPAAASAGPSPEALKADDLLRGLRVLLVEDHDVTRRAAGRLLTSRGARVLEAGTGREALHLLVHEQPHVLLLDLMLPDADGTDILRHLRTHRPVSLKCVLAVSGDVRDGRIQEIRELGADDLLPKPLNIEKLLEAIAAVLNKNEIEVPAR